MSPERAPRPDPPEPGRPPQRRRNAAAPPPSPDRRRLTIGAAVLAFALCVAFGLRFADGGDALHAVFSALWGVAAIVWSVRAWRTFDRAE